MISRIHPLHLRESLPINENVLQWSFSCTHRQTCGPSWGLRIPIRPGRRSVLSHQSEWPVGLVWWDWKWIGRATSVDSTLVAQLCSASSLLDGIWSAECRCLEAEDPGRWTVWKVAVVALHNPLRPQVLVRPACRICLGPKYRPAFRPGETDIREYCRKLEFLASLWPAEHLSLLAPRAAMLCEGRAFQRVMRVETDKLKSNSLEGVKALVQSSGAWGPIRRVRTSHLHHNTAQWWRHDHQFESLLSSGVTLTQLQAYILLRNSGLSSDDKKKLIVDSGGSLEYETVVKSSKLIGSRFFQEVHAGTKNPTRSKTYDINAVLEEEVNTLSGSVSATDESVFVGETDDSFIESMAEEGDPDALVCQQLEDAIVDVLQQDAETAACYMTYVEARRRLTDRNKSRGFWVPGGSSNSVKGSKGRGKGKFQGRSRKPLAARILESECQICGQKGHWKAECPLRNVNAPPGSNPQPKENATFNTMTVTHVQEEMTTGDMIPMDDMDVTLLHLGHVGIPQVCDCLVTSMHPQVSNKFSPCLRNLPQRLVPLLPQRAIPDQSPQPVPAGPVGNRQDVSCHEVACFASHGSLGIVDLGASQSVIGENQLSKVLSSLDPAVRRQVKEISCDTIFRFGNGSTVHCHRAVLIPLGKWFVKLCIVSSDTPFLLANNMFRTLGARRDTATDQVYLANLDIDMKLTLSEKNLYLLDFGKLVNRSFSRHGTSENHKGPQAGSIMTVEMSEKPNSDQHVPADGPHETNASGNLGTSVHFDRSQTVLGVTVPDRTHGQPSECASAFPGREVSQCDGSDSTVLGSSRLHPTDSAGVGQGHDLIRRSQKGHDLREGGADRSVVRELVHEQVCSEQEVRASTIAALHSEVRGTSQSSSGIDPAKSKAKPKSATMTALMAQPRRWRFTIRPRKRDPCGISSRVSVSRLTTWNRIRVLESPTWRWPSTRSWDSFKIWPATWRELPLSRTCDLFPSLFIRVPQSWMRINPGSITVRTYWCWFLPRWVTQCWSCWQLGVRWNVVALVKETLLPWCGCSVKTFFSTWHWYPRSLLL